MIDASATAIGRGPIAVNGLKNSGSQDDGASTDQGFGDYLEEASTGSTGGELSAEESGGKVAGEGKLARSIISLFAIAQNGEVSLNLQAGAAASSVGAETTTSLLGRTPDLSDEDLSSILFGADGADTADQLAAIIAELQDAGMIADPSEDDVAPSIPEEGSALEMLFADAEAEAGETIGAAHHLLSALSKALTDDNAEETAADDQAIDAEGLAESPASEQSLTQNAVAPIVVKTADVSDSTSTAGTDSAKDALAQISSQSHQGKVAQTELNGEETAKQSAKNDEINLDGFDQLTVLDSRRYLGFGGDNAKLLTTALVGEANRALAPYATTTDLNAQATATTVNTLKIQMNPENLGTMTASLRLKGDELSVEVTVDTIEGYRHLAKDQSAIVQSLRDQGFTVDQVSIQLNPTPKSETQQQDQGQNGSNQNLREGQGDAQRQQSGDGRSTPRTERLSILDGQSMDVDASRSSGASGDGLYL